MNFQGKKQKKRVLVTGTSGMLGKDIFFELVNNDYIVFGVDLKNNPILPEQFQKIGDLTEKNFTLSVLEKIKPDIIIHCAAVVNLETCQNNKLLAHTVHVDVTNWLAQFKPNDTKLIYISTDSVFDGEKGNYKETDKPHPLNYYAISKLDGEQMAKLNPNHIIIRTNIFGFDNPLRGSLSEWAIKNFQKNTPIQGFTDVIFNAIYTKHLAKIILSLVKSDFRGLINVASKNIVSKYEFLSILINQMGVSQSLISKSLSSEVSFAISRPLITNLDIQQIQQLTTIPTIEEGIKEMVKDFNKLNRTDQNETN
ncbi:MAG: SDR family oxidoreductase [Bacteroidales bacterium]|nr:SDR family oxidoreductase [Bacteroidales bacterium]